MSRPTTQIELLDQMETVCEKLLAEVDRLSPEERLMSGVCEEWSVKDLLAHLDAWHELFLEWERVGSAGDKPEMPAPDLTWKDTPILNEQIWQRTKDDSYAEVTKRFSRSYATAHQVIAGYDADALFEKRRYKWTGSTSVGSYAVSATSSHYDWARKLIRKFKKTRSTGN